MRSQSNKGKPVERNKPCDYNKHHRNSCLSFSNNENESKIDEEVIEKYCNILSQKTLTSKESSRTQKSLLNGFGDTDFAKEANKTCANKDTLNKHISSRGLSQTRMRVINPKSSNSKSVGRANTKRSVVRKKNMINHTGTRNLNFVGNTESHNTVTKRVGGGYSSFACAEKGPTLQHSKSVASQNHQKSQVINKEKVKGRNLPGSKRRSCEDLTKNELESKSITSSAKVFSPSNSSRHTRLIRK